MTREEWLRAWGFQDGTPEADQAWAEKQAFVPIRLSPLIIPDIAPYKAVAADLATGKAPVISSRREHREFLKRNDYVELGNEMPKPREKPEPDRMEIGRTIKRVMDEKGIRA